jgi:hypothetical protein
VSSLDLDGIQKIANIFATGKEEALLEHAREIELLAFKLEADQAEQIRIGKQLNIIKNK